MNKLKETPVDLLFCLSHSDIDKYFDEQESYKNDVKDRIDHLKEVMGIHKVFASNMSPTCLYGSLKDYFLERNWL